MALSHGPLFCVFSPLDFLARHFLRSVETCTARFAVRHWFGIGTGVVQSAILLECSHEPRISLRYMNPSTDLGLYTTYMLYTIPLLPPSSRLFSSMNIRMPSRSDDSLVPASSLVQRKVSLESHSAMRVASRITVGDEYPCSSNWRVARGSCLPRIAALRDCRSRSREFRSCFSLISQSLPASLGMVHC